MKKQTKKTDRRNFGITVCLLTAFVLWTIAVGSFDVQSIGPRDSEVGFATVNGWIHGFIGVHMQLYVITDWLGLVPLGVAFGFGVFGFVQLIKRRGVFKVDYSILVLGGFYILVMSAYVFFEMYVINYRPVLIEGYLEASYPSSTTMLVTTVMPTTIMQLSKRAKNSSLRWIMKLLINSYIVFMVVGRLVSGVHWMTDIIGGLLLSAGLVMLYYSVVTVVENRTDHTV